MRAVADLGQRERTIAFASRIQGAGKKLTDRKLKDGYD
jgi:hypothetical protein